MLYRGRNPEPEPPGQHRGREKLPTNREKPRAGPGSQRGTFLLRVGRLKDEKERETVQREQREGERETGQRKQRDGAEVQLWFLIKESKKNANEPKLFAATVKRQMQGFSSSDSAK